MCCGDCSNELQSLALALRCAASTRLDTVYLTGGVLRVLVDPAEELALQAGSSMRTERHAS